MTAVLVRVDLYGPDLMAQARLLNDQRMRDRDRTC